MHALLDIGTTLALLAALAVGLELAWGAALAAVDWTMSRRFWRTR
jgi:hypothetical protein